LAFTEKDAVSLGMKIGDLLADTNVSCHEGLKILLGLAVFAAVETEMKEEEFLDICKNAYKSGLETADILIVIEESSEKPAAN
jgi:hypothetical protein